MAIPSGAKQAFNNDSSDSSAPPMPPGTETADIGTLPPLETPVNPKQDKKPDEEKKDDKPFFLSTPVILFIIIIILIIMGSMIVLSLTTSTQQIVSQYTTTFMTTLPLNLPTNTISPTPTVIPVNASEILLDQTYLSTDHLGGVDKGFNYPSSWTIRAELTREQEAPEDSDFYISIGPGTSRGDHINGEPITLVEMYKGRNSEFIGVNMLTGYTVAVTEGSYAMPTIAMEFWSDKGGNRFGYLREGDIYAWVNPDYKAEATELLKRIAQTFSLIEQ